jgi:hypothetical protein
MKSALVLSALCLISACEPETKAAEAPTPAAPPPVAEAPAPPPPAPPAEPVAPAPAPAAEPPDADPRINAIRARYQALETDATLQPTTKIEADCQEGMTKLAAQLYDKDGLQKAEVRFQPPGDATFVYKVYFDQQEPVLVLRSMLGFAGGTTSLTEHRFYFADGKPVRCLSKSATGGAGEDLSELQIAERVQQATNKEGDCKEAKRAVAVARALTSKDPKAALIKQCPL